MLEGLIGLLRPLQFKGAGTLFDRFTPWNGVRDIRVAGDVKMRLDLANGQQRQMFMGCFARELQADMRAILKPGDTFVDVGANVGYTSLLAAHLVGTGGRVFGVEPYPPTFTTLVSQIERNDLPQVKMFQRALAAEAGTLTLYVPPASEHREFNVSMVPSESAIRVDVPCMTLDESFDEWAVTAVDLMKVDVEGAEPLVFRGGQRHLSAGTVRNLICEINGKYLVKNNSSPMLLIKQLQDLGFVMSTFKSGSLKPLRPIPQLGPADEIDGIFVHSSVIPNEGTNRERVASDHGSENKTVRNVSSERCDVA